MKKNSKKGKKGGMHVATLCLSTTMVLIILGLIVLFLLTARNISNTFRENMTVSLLLNDSVSVNQGHELTRMLCHRSYTNGIDYIGKDEVLKKHVESIGADPMEFLDENPFAASIEITLRANYANSDSLKWIEKEWKATGKISDIIYQQDLMDLMNKNIKRISLILIIVAVILLVVSFSLINNTIRLGVYSQRFKMHTMKLVGATYRFIRRPYLKKMLLVGVISSIAACMILGGGVLVLFDFEPNAVSVVTTEVLTITGLTIFVAGIVITLACGFFSVNRFLRMKARDLYRY